MESLKPKRDTQSNKISKVTDVVGELMILTCMIVLMGALVAMVVIAFKPTPYMQLKKELVVEMKAFLKESREHLSLSYGN